MIARAAKVAVNSPDVARLRQLWPTTALSMRVLPWQCRLLYVVCHSNVTLRACTRRGRIAATDSRGLGRPVAPLAVDDLRPPLADHIAILGVEFHRPALAPGLLTGDERRAAAAEGVHNDIPLPRRVPTEIDKHLRRLHRRMDGLLLRLVEIHDRGLGAVGVPGMGTAVLPAVKARFVNPL